MDPQLTEARGRGRRTYAVLGVGTALLVSAALALRVGLANRKASVQQAVPTGAIASNAHPSPAASSDVELATSSSDDEPRVPSVTVVIKKSAIVIDDGQTPSPEPVIVLDAASASGAPASYKRASGAFLLVPLKAALLARVQKSGPSIVDIVCDARASYRVLTEVMYTIGQADLRSMELVVRNGDRAAVQRVELPGGRAVQQPVEVDTVIAHAGFIVDLQVDAGRFAEREPNALDGLRTGRLGVGCATYGAGIAVPARNGEQDYAGISNCMQSLLRGPAAPAARQQPHDIGVTLSADADVSFQTVVSVRDAVDRVIGHDVPIHYGVPR